MKPDTSVPIYIEIYDGTGKRITFEANSFNVVHDYNERPDPDNRLTTTRDLAHVEVEIDTDEKLSQ